MGTQNILLAIVLPLVAVGIGVLSALIIKPSINNGVKLLLSFSGAFLLAITIFEFLPEIYTGGTENIGLFIMAGLVMQLLLEFGSKGAEHGHVHLEAKMKFPILLFISLSIHAIIEGFPIGDKPSLLYGVMIHKIPIAIIITAFLLNANLARWKSVVFLVGFGLMTPLGAFAKAHLPLLQSYTAQLDAFAVGVLLHVATTILFESSRNHQFNASKFVAILIGIGTAYLL